MSNGMSYFCFMEVIRIPANPKEVWNHRSITMSEKSKVIKTGYIGVFTMMSAAD